MKKLSVFFAIATTAILLQAHSCNHHDDYPSVCGTDRICTEIFKAVTVKVTDTAGAPIELDDYYTIREKTGERITGPGSIVENGYYVVVDDNFIATLMNKTEGFRFIGKKNGVEVVNEIYQITGDCCHVNKDNGKDTVIIQ